MPRNINLNNKPADEIGRGRPEAEKQEGRTEKARRKYGYLQSRANMSGGVVGGGRGVQRQNDGTATFDKLPRDFVRSWQASNGITQWDDKSKKEALAYYTATQTRNSYVLGK